MRKVASHQKWMYHVIPAKALHNRLDWAGLKILGGRARQIKSEQGESWEEKIRWILCELLEYMGNNKCMNEVQCTKLVSSSYPLPHLQLVIPLPNCYSNSLSSCNINSKMIWHIKTVLVELLSKPYPALFHPVFFRLPSVFSLPVGITDLQQHLPAVLEGSVKDADCAGRGRSAPRALLLPPGGALSPHW